MAWFKVDDKLHSHKKSARAGVAAMGLWTLAGSWSADQLTDGFIPDYIAERLAPGASEQLAKELVAAGLWVDDVYDGDTGWRFRDWTDYQPTRDDVEAQREVSRRRWAMRVDPDLRQALKERDGDRCRYCGEEVNWKDRRGAKGGTYDHVTPLSKGGDESVDNLVVCCRECNAKKASRTASEAGMSLTDPGPTQVDSGSTKASRPDPSRPKEPTSKRATRIPDDWQPDDEPSLTSEADSAGIDLTRELARFRDYWQAQSGQRGRKADWQATWRNWLRKAVDDRGGPARASPPVDRFYESPYRRKRPA